MEVNHSRRTIISGAIKGFFSIFLFSSLASLLFSSCKKSCAEEKAVAASSSKGEPKTCPEQKLTEQEESIRQTLKYVDHSPIAQRTCQNCKVYIEPAKSQACGGCKVVPGLVHPNGYCTAWIARL